MRIVHIISGFFNLAGIESVITTLSLEQKKSGHDIHVISLYDGESAFTDKMAQAGIKIHYLAKKAGFDIRVLLSLCSAIKEIKPDIVHAHQRSLPYAALAAKQANVNHIVYTSHCPAKKEAPTVVRRLLYRLCFHFLGVVPVGLCPVVQKNIAQLYDLPLAKVGYVHNGIDLSRCLNRDKTTHSGEEFRFLHVGRFSEEKNHAGLIEAFSIIHSRHPGAGLDLVGKGELEDAVRAQANMLGLQDCVRMLGEKDDVFPYYAKADAFIFPSLFEGFGLALVEAMGTGLPVIASAVDGIPGVIEDGVSGLLCTTEPKDIAARMEELISDPALCERLGQAAKERAKMFSAQSMAEGYLNIYSGNI